MPLDLDLRKRVMKSIESGERITHVARQFDVSRKAIYSWIKLYKITGSIKPKSGYHQGHSHKITDLDELKRFVEKHRNWMAKDMAIKWSKLHNTEVSLSIFCRYLKKINFTLKKNFQLRRSR